MTTHKSPPAEIIKTIDEIILPGLVHFEKKLADGEVKKQYLEAIDYALDLRNKAARRFSAS